ncbi:MAG: serine hydrolase [Tissierellia bacterium]|nr:serine hydrolase [Tissierellia bacterium]
MKKKFLVVIALALFIYALSRKHEERLLGFFPNEVFTDTGIISAENFAVVDLETDEVLAAKKAKEKISPASLSKLFSIYMVDDLFNLDDKIEVSQEAMNLVGENSSLANILPGTYYLENIYHAILAPSGNDAMYALANFVGGYFDEDLTECQDRVIAYRTKLNLFLQANDFMATRIKDVTGYSRETYTNIEDLIDLSKELIKKEWFIKLVSQAEYVSMTPSGKYLSWLNTNKFLDSNSEFYNPNIKGIKTGSLENYKNIISLYEKDGKKYLIIVIGAKSDELRYTDTLNLVEKYINY